MIENRHDRVDYLLETTGFSQEDLLTEIVRAMSDQEFDDIYQFICRMHDIEPDMEKFAGYLELGGYDRAIQGKRANQ
jgi:aminoglycoside phosphotransferase family enzyme